MTSCPTAEDAASAAAGLLADHTAGTWAPTPDERMLAKGIARVGPSAASLRTGLRHIAPGRFADVLAVAAAYLETVATGEPDERLLPLHHLLDALAPRP
ncbi:hypothetical protein AB0L26_09315 [Streptomyces nondiastaticus]|uniref:hypothetical protein n=1 Tax=Streptomyces nondiastaticus TaxID=3154512 RepID=UPI0034416F18